jgi:surface carbohydrate biosynthesis protein
MSRAFLAAKLAADGHRILVFVSDLFDRFGWPGPGVYIGKNVLRGYAPHDLRFYREMRRAGLQIWYHDEESLFPGIEPSDWDKHLGDRTNASVFAADDKILAWGRFQADYFHRVGVEASVHVVGSVNFELYRPEYHEAFAPYDREQTKGYKNYILFNTRFGTPNSPYPGPGHVINSDLYKSWLDTKSRFNLLSHEGVVLYEFIGLIAQLALTKPDLPIVVRPHPGENATLYREIFAEFEQITVTGEGDAGSWIRQCSCLVQNGCTTAIQANITGKRVITFVPPGTDAPEVSSPLPNEVGQLVATREEAIAAILGPAIDQRTGRWPLAVSSLETIRDISMLVGERPADKSLDEERLRRLAARSASDMRFRRLAYYAFAQKKKEAELRERFLDRKLFSDFPSMAALAAGHFQHPLKVERMGPDCWSIESART